MTDEPASAQPATGKSVTSEPASAKPGAGKSATDEPASAKPAAGGRLPEAVLSVEDLQVVFARSALARLVGKSSGVRAVDGVSLHVSQGEVLGVVGESGSGKTTLALASLRLTPVTGGRVLYRGVDLTKARRRTVDEVRKEAVMIFQDPHSSLSPRMRVSSLLTEPYAIHRIPPAERYGVTELLSMVELPSRLARLYPHELSGGQARRVGIARALALRPRLIVADEPTAGLDVSAASAILNLLHSLRAKHGTAYLIITHALNVVGYLADRIVVMYLGKVVETGSAEEVYDRPLHPYTRALIAAIPELGPPSEHPPAVIEGEIPSPRNPPSGCRFHTRCPYATEICTTIEPLPEEARPGQWVACHRWREIEEAGESTDRVQSGPRVKA